MHWRIDCISINVQIGFTLKSYEQDTVLAIQHIYPASFMKPQSSADLGKVKIFWFWFAKIWLKSPEQHQHYNASSINKEINTNKQW